MRRRRAEPTVVAESDDVVLGGRYRLRRRLGSGGSGTVYLAEDERLGRQVAVKRLHRGFGAPAAARIEREARRTAALSHPNVVQIHDVGGDGDRAYIVMELAEGEPLDEVLARVGPLDPERVIATGLMLCDALTAAHGKGIVHRDIKPANVIVAPDGTAKLTDFGTARTGQDDTLTGAGTLIGSAAYVAPEQLRPGRVDARCDIYALGVLLYEAVSGERPFVGDSVAATAIQRLHRDPYPPSLHGEVPAALEQVILKALARDPQDRFQTAAELATALRAVQARLAAGTTDAIPAVAAPTRPRRAWLLLVIPALLAAGGLLTGFDGSPPEPTREPAPPPAGATVPEVEGQSLSEAASRLRDAGLTVADVATVASDAPAGTVIDQLPDAGRAVQRGTGVELLVSDGEGIGVTHDGGAAETDPGPVGGVREEPPPEATETTPPRRGRGPPEGRGRGGKDGD